MRTIDDLLNTIPDDEAIARCPWKPIPAAVRKIKKEMFGESLMKKYHVFENFYKERYARVTDKETQLSGIDFKGYTHNVDIKVSLGNFSDDLFHIYECIPIELMQNSKRSFTQDKKTTEVLYINYNVDTETAYFVSVPYDLILKIVDTNLSSDAFTKFANKLYIPDRRTSDNGSGLFIKMPINKIESYEGVKYMKIEEKV